MARANACTRRRKKSSRFRSEYAWVALRADSGEIDLELLHLRQRLLRDGARLGLVDTHHTHDRLRDQSFRGRRAPSVKNVLDPAGKQPDQKAPGGLPIVSRDLIESCLDGLVHVVKP